VKPHNPPHDALFLIGWRYDQYSLRGRVREQAPFRFDWSGGMGYPLSPDTYHQIARALPRPSSVQRVRFARHVAAARPWAMFLPADAGVPFTLFLNPQAGRALSRDSAGSITARDQDSGAHTADYYEAFGYLDYATPVASGSGAVTGADLGLPGDYYVLDERSRAAPLPAALLEVATCALNATLHPDAAMLLRTLPLRVPALLDAGSDRLEPIVDDDELRAFVEEYVREELAGFVCPTDREAWESRWLQSFERLYAPRNAEQRARLERALGGLLAWVYEGPS
jgi:hypothetical protein